MPHHHHSHHNPKPFGEIRSRKHHDILHPRMMIPLQGLTGAKELYAHQLKVDLCLTRIRPPQP